MRHDLEQGSQEWHDFRRTHIGASEAAIIMGEDRYKRSLKSLWEEKMGFGSQIAETASMARGKALEPMILEQFRLVTGHDLKPAVYTSDDTPYMSASYDGISDDGTVACEIKCISKELHEIARQGRVPQCYYAQVQQQIYVNNIKEMFYISFNDNDLIYLKVNRDDGYIRKLLDSSADFWELVMTCVPPKSAFVERDDIEWKRIAHEMQVYKAKADEFQGLYEQARQALIELSGGVDTRGGGIELVRSVRKGNVMYKNIPELKGVNLEDYRSKSSEFYRITTQGDAA